MENQTILEAAMAKVEQRAATPTSECVGSVLLEESPREKRALALQHKQPQTVEGFFL